MSAASVDLPRILLVDDSMLMRKAASKMLGEEFDIVTAVDGVDGWEKIQADPAIQVVFTDLLMPRMDGYALLQQIRAAEDDGTVNLPVIVVTGAENDESARRSALDLGATDFITKPFSSVDLLARARAHANHRRIAKQLEQQAKLDPLTGLANKAGFLDQLQKDLAFALRHAQPLTLVRIDIDDFRNVFLRRGKAVAEALVQHVARHLHDTVRQEDTAARVGLASFSLLLAAGQHEGSRGLVERLRVHFASDEFAVDGKPLPYTISAAVVTPPLSEDTTPDGALEECESLLQVALRSGGNRVEGGLRAPLDAGEAGSPAPVEAAPSGPPVLARVEVSRSPAPPAPPAAKLPSEARLTPPATPPAPAPTPVERVDEALACIERGESLAVIARLPQLLKRLVPLFRMLSAQQRAQLVAFLQKLGT